MGVEISQESCFRIEVLSLQQCFFDFRSWGEYSTRPGSTSLNRELLSCRDGLALFTRTAWPSRYCPGLVHVPRALGGGSPEAYSSFCETRVETADGTLMVLCKVCTTSCLEDPRAQEPACAHLRLLQAEGSRVCLLGTFSPRFCTPPPPFFFLTLRGSLVFVVETLALLLLPPPPSEKPTAAGEMISKLAVGIERATCRRGTGGSGQGLPLGADQHASSRVSLSRQRLGHADFFFEKFQLIRETPPGPPRARVPAPTARAPLRPPPTPSLLQPGPRGRGSRNIGG